MKFLEKIEDAINALLEKLGSKLLQSLKNITPEIIPHYYQEISKIIPIAKEKLKALGPKLKILGIKTVGYCQHALHVVQGKIHGTILYLKSDEFKKANKKDMLLSPLTKLKGSFKVNPVKTTIAVSAAIIFFVGIKLISVEMWHVREGFLKLRAPASADLVAIEDNTLLLGTYTFDVTTQLNQAVSAEKSTPPPPAAPAAVSMSHSSNGQILTGPEVPAEKFESEEFIKAEQIAIEVRLKFESSKFKNKIALNKDLVVKIENIIKKLSIPNGITLPLDSTEKALIAQNIDQQIKDEKDFEALYQYPFIWEIDQEEIKKPNYHLAHLRQHRFNDISLQLLIEESRRNRQVYFEFVVQTINREGALIIKAHEAAIKDHLMMNVEPVVPGLPLDDEGKRIIRDKVKFEINLYFKKHQLKTQVEEVYIEYILAS